MRPLLLAALFVSFASAQSALELRSGTWRGRHVSYRIVNGAPIAEGDIILDRVDDPESLPEKAPSRDASGITSLQFRWIDKTIPYIIDADVPNPARVEDAIQHWNGRTVIHFTPRGEEKNYVRFIRDNSNAGVCSSLVGMAGGEQPIRLPDDCSPGAIIHEIGHAVGLFHEQSRLDRDEYVSILWNSIDSRRWFNYESEISRSSDIGFYDYGSIMHYSSLSGFVTDPSGSAIETIPAGIPIAQSVALSPGDIDAVSRMYGVPVTATTVDTFPSGLDIVVDGATYKAPHVFDWPFGTEHTLDVPTPQGSGSTRYVFARWNDNGGQRHTFTASPDSTVLSAAFSRQFLVPSGPRTGAGSVVMEPSSPDGYYADGTPVVVTASPAAGYVFYSWSSTPSGVHGLRDNPALTRIRGSYDYRAFFLEAPPNITVDSDPPHMRFLADDISSTALRAFVWTAGSVHQLGVASPQTGPAGVTRYIFTGWDDSQERSRSITAPTTPTNYKVNFRTEHLLTIGIDGLGTVDRSSDRADGFYEAGSTIDLIPRPGPGYQFVDWTGDLTGIEANRSVRMDRPRYLIATFRLAGSTPARGVLNAATLQPGSVAPGELLVINGTHGAPKTDSVAEVGADGSLPTSLADTRVLIGGQYAPILRVNGNQVTTMVPAFQEDRRLIPVQIEYQRRLSTFVNVEVAKAVPGVFTVDGSGAGAVAATNEDGSPNGDTNPATRGSAITFQATGFGQMTSNGSALVPVLPVSVTIAGVEATVLSASSIPGRAGIVQVSVRVPSDAATGSVPLALTAGKISSRQRLSVAIR